MVNTINQLPVQELVKFSFITWEDAKTLYPDKWVVFRKPIFKDKFEMELIGGEFVGIADDLVEMYKLIPDEYDGNTYVPQHTGEE